jgi:hypothetical protein
MSDWGEANTESAVQGRKHGRKAIAVSPRKLAANRRNSLKSTGPRTPRGKAYSRQNAIKHGLFVLDVFPDFIKRETQREFQQRLDQLWQEYQPVGTAEELEVERIATCWWRRRRAWRYENAVMSAGLFGVAQKDIALKNQKALLPEWRTLLQLLESAEKEIEATGAISQELKDKMFASVPWFGEVWGQLEQFINDGGPLARQKISSMKIAHLIGSSSDLASTIRIAAVTSLAIRHIELRNEECMETAEQVTNAGYDYNALPSHDVMDRILRYEAAIERDLNRSLDRLERLQRRRRGETVPPPLNVQLTR